MTQILDDQWHLQNTGQTGGNAGEDANITLHGMIIEAMV